MEGHITHNTGMKRIVLTGAESTGKSTLAKALAIHYNAPISDEFVRHYVDQLDRELTDADLLPIALGQLSAEAAATKKATSIVFHDTNILSSIIYAKHYFNESVTKADNAIQGNHYSLYLLCETDIPWVADEGQRESPETRQELQTLFELELQNRDLPYIKISGTLEDRVQQSIRAIDQLLQ